VAEINENDEFMLDGEVAAKLRTSRRQANRLAKEGVLPAVKLPGLRGYRFLRSGVDQAIKAGRVAGGERHE
jgi:excisionase family DNA binding protein